MDKGAARRVQPAKGDSAVERVGQRFGPDENNHE
jgi:hypothetical protein